MSCCPTCGRRVTRIKQASQETGDNQQTDLFTSYKRSAPRLDLAFYIAHATRQERLNAQAEALLAKMVALHELIEQRGDSGMEKAAVWALIGAFKAATIDWTTGQANGCKQMRSPLPSRAGERAAAKVWEMSPLMRATRRAKVS